MSSSEHGLIERLFRQRSVAIAAFIGRRIRRKSDAVDLTQEVYLRVLRAWRSGTVENPEGYLFTVAANLVKEHAAAEARTGVALELPEAGFSELLTQHPVHDSAHDLDARSVRLREVLALLPPKCRTAMHLRHQRDLSYQEIGVLLGVSTNMVKKYLTQGLAHCRRHMAEF